MPHIAHSPAVRKSILRGPETNSPRCFRTFYRERHGFRERQYSRSDLLGKCHFYEWGVGSGEWSFVQIGYLFRFSCLLQVFRNTTHHLTTSNHGIQSCQGPAMIRKDRSSNGMRGRIMDVVVEEMIGPDLANGFLETLANLSPVGLTLKEAVEIFRTRLHTGVRTFIARVDGQVVGTASLLIERKFIHKGGRVGHIEDVAVHKEFEGHGIGSALVRHALAEARNLR